MRINVFLSCFVLLGLLMLPYSDLSVPYGSVEDQKERAGDISTGLRLLARILINLIQSGLILGSGYLTMWRMDKFSSESRSYFSLSISNEPLRVLVIYGLFAPLLYLVFFLRQYKRHGQKQYVLSYIAAMLAAELITSLIEDVQKNLRLVPGLLSESIWFLGIFLVVAMCFWRCRGLEDEIEMAARLHKL